VAEPVAEAGEHGDRLGETAGAGEGTHEQQVRTLAPGVGGHELGQAGDGGVGVVLEFALREVLDCAEAQLLEPGGLGLGGRDVDAGEGRTTPEREGLGEPTLRGERLELGGIGGGGEKVAGRTGHDRLAGQPGA